MTLPRSRLTRNSTSWPRGTQCAFTHYGLRRAFAHGHMAGWPVCVLLSWEQSYFLQNKVTHSDKTTSRKPPRRTTGPTDLRVRGGHRRGTCDQPWPQYTSSSDQATATSSSASPNSRGASSQGAFAASNRSHLQTSLQGQHPAHDHGLMQQRSHACRPYVCLHLGRKYRLWRTSPWSFDGLKLCRLAVVFYTV